MPFVVVCEIEIFALLQNWTIWALNSVSISIWFKFSRKKIGNPSGSEQTFKILRMDIKQSGLLKIKVVEIDHRMCSGHRLLSVLTISHLSFVLQVRRNIPKVFSQL